MKRLAGLALLFASPTVLADTALIPETCNTPGAQCQEAAGPNTTLVYAPQYGRVMFYTLSKTYDSGLYAVPLYATRFSALPLYAPDGSVEYLTVSFTTYRTCNVGGRGQSCLTHWVLQSGSLSP